MPPPPEGDALFLQLLAVVRGGILIVAREQLQLDWYVQAPCVSAAFYGLVQLVGHSALLSQLQVQVTELLRSVIAHACQTGYLGLKHIQKSKRIPTAFGELGDC